MEQLKSYPVGLHDAPIDGRVFPLKESKVIKAVLLCLFGVLPISATWISHEHFAALRHLVTRPGLSSKSTFKALVDTFRPSAPKGSGSNLAPIMIPILGTILYQLGDMNLLPGATLLVFTFSILGWSFFDLDISRTGLPLYIRIWSVWLPQVLIAFALTQWFNYLDATLVSSFIIAIALLFLQSYAYSVFTLAVVGFLFRAAFLSLILDSQGSLGSTFVGIIVNTLSTSGLIPLTLHSSWALPHLLLYALLRVPYSILSIFKLEYDPLDAVTLIYSSFPTIRLRRGFVRFALLLHLYSWENAKYAFRYPLKMIHHFILAVACLLSAAGVSIAAGVYSYYYGPLKFW